MLKGINWAGVVAAVIVNQLLGWAWYGMLFKDKFASVMSAKASTPVGYVEGALIDLVMIAGIAWILARMGRTGLTPAVMTAVGLWVTFPLMISLMNWLYIGEPMDMVMLDAGYSLLHTLIAAALIATVKLPGKAAA